MKRGFAGCDGRDQLKFPDLNGCRTGLHRHTWVWLLGSALAMLGAADSSLAAPKPVSAQRKNAVEVPRHKHVTVVHLRKIQQPTARDAAAEPLPPHVAATKQVIDLVRLGKVKDATTLATAIADPAAAKLVEWALLRRFDREAGFDRYAAFIRANPDWPSIPLLRRRAETRLWEERRDGATVRGFVGEEPTSVYGRLALLRVKMGEGDHAEVGSDIRALWQSAQLSADLEAEMLAAFPNVLTRADHVARMDTRIGARDFGSAMRAAKRAGDDQVAIVKACAAVAVRSAKGGALLDSVRADAREDLGYALCRLQWLLRNELPGSNLRGRIVTPKEDIAAAVKLTLAASQHNLQHQDTDEWWRELRVLARKLIDRGDPATAYEVVRAAAPPANPYYCAEFHFMAGWIALRFLNDPAEAYKHFAHVDEGTADPIVLARAAYWRGRAAEAAGRLEDMYAQYQAAARYPTAYYGQLARARLGVDDLASLRPPPEAADDSTNELLRAAHILYEIGEGQLALSFVSDLAEESNDPALIAGLGRLAERHNDAEAMLLIGKTAVARGLPMDVYAFPAVGVPNYTPIGSQLDRCIVYAIVRAESGFNQTDISAAKAIGLMQVTPQSGRETAKRFGVAYNWRRLVSDPVYNTQMGAAELSTLLKDYRGSFILTFAGYNAGRERVKQWMTQHGDPRDPKIDAVDWVERIPFAETRNYVERVMENLLVYHKRFGDVTAAIESNLHRATIVGRHPKPATIEEGFPPTAVDLSIRD